MDRMCEELIIRIEKTLDITFHEWQRNYLLNEPMLLDMRMTGRCTGKTLIFVIKQLFKSSEPLYIRNKMEVLNVADWWCCENRIDRATHHPYLDWFKHELRDIYENLNKSGIKTREVIFK